MAGRFQVAGCGIIEKEGKVLITRRHPDRWMGGFWEFVSGRVEQGEELIDGLRREIREEVNLNVEPLYPIYVSHFYRGEGHLRIKKPENEVFLVTYICRWISEKVVLKTDEQDKYEWVNLRDIDLNAYPGLKEMFREEIEIYLEVRDKLLN